MSAVNEIDPAEASRLVQQLNSELKNQIGEGKLPPQLDSTNPQIRIVIYRAVNFQRRSIESMALDILHGATAVPYFL